MPPPSLSVSASRAASPTRSASRLPSAGSQCAPGAPTSVAVVAADSMLAVSWQAPAGNGVVTNYTVRAVVASGATSPLSVFGPCSQPRNTSATVSGVHLFRVALPAVNGVAYSVTVAAAGPCGAGPPSAPLAATVAPPRLPVDTPPVLWLDARAFPACGAASARLAAATLPDLANNAFKLYATTPATTRIALLQRPGGRVGQALSFAGLGGDMFVPTTTAGAVSSASDKAKFGWKGGADADNDMTIVAAFQSSEGFNGGSVISKGGYYFFGDSGWHVVSGISGRGYMGMRAQMSSGAPVKRNPALPRADMAIYFTSPQQSPAAPGILTTFEFYRPNATSNTTMQLDACKGVATGVVSDACSKLESGVSSTSQWFPKISKIQTLAHSAMLSAGPHPQRS